MSYDFEEERILAGIKSSGAKRVLLQMPEGLKPYGFSLAKSIENRAAVEVIVSGDPCYGACDLALYPMQRTGAELLVHVGHAQIPREGPSNGVLYVEAHAKVDVEKALESATQLLKNERRIGLAVTAQHMQMLERAKTFLESSGKMVILGRPSGWLKYEGQVLGCDYGTVRSIANQVDAFLLLGGGDFHALGIPLATGKRTIVADPFQGKARDITELCRKILRQRYAVITKFKEAKRIGVIAGLKSSQMNLALARRLKQLLEGSGREAVIICAMEVTPESLDSFVDLDAYVEIACPRISIDDRERYRKPILNPEEVMIALGKKQWEDYGKGDTFETYH